MSGNYQSPVILYHFKSLKIFSPPSCIVFIPSSSSHEAFSSSGIFLHIKKPLRFWPSIKGEKNSWMVIFKFSVNGFNLFKLQIHFCLWNGRQENARTSVKSGNTAIFIPHAYQTCAVTHQRLIFESCTLKAMSLYYLILIYLLYKSKQRNPQFLRYLWTALASPSNESLHTVI